ncbi:mediator of RNA polymerase II transcription subunit 19-like [Brachionus plicatilis]|uniref:Mediator of RNA polymerase II transcription subunit 19 n=1 Tax=Brachionus plicatilis TaxID=10195 RepID=A0A3M7Q5W8_BRAPC|nr:mediator of RNA polymerase II transcription subunit 19-like [Brachionus plicatilis]
MEQAMSYEDLTNQYFLNPDPAFSDQRNEMTELNQQESHELPFYLMRMCPPEEPLNGATNLILHNERQQAFKQYCCKKVKEPLSAFLPDFPGNIDTTTFFTTGDEAKETSTLNSLLDPKLQVVEKEIHPPTFDQVSYSFRLYPGTVPSEYMVMVQTALPSSEFGSSKKSKKSKRSSNEGENGEKRKKKKDKKKKKEKDKDKEKEKKSSGNPAE